MLIVRREYASTSVRRAVVAQQVEHFLGKEEVRRFEPAQQLQLSI